MKLFKSLYNLLIFLKIENLEKKQMELQLSVMEKVKRTEYIMDTFKNPKLINKDLDVELTGLFLDINYDQQQVSLLALKKFELLNKTRPKSLRIKPEDQAQTIKAQTIKN